MDNVHTISLLELALTQQRAHNEAALEAIRGRAVDLEVVQTLVQQLAERGATVRPVISTYAIGQKMQCNVALWLTTTQAAFDELTQWMKHVADIIVQRAPMRDMGEVEVYDLTLGQGFRVWLNVAVHRPVVPPRYRYETAA